MTTDMFEEDMGSRRPAGDGDSTRHDGVEQLNYLLPKGLPALQGAFRDGWQSLKCLRLAFYVPPATQWCAKHRKFDIYMHGRSQHHHSDTYRSTNEKNEPANKWKITAGRSGNGSPFIKPRQNLVDALILPQNVKSSGALLLNDRNPPRY